MDGTDAQTTEGSLHMLRESGECDATGGEERATRTNVNLRALHLLLDVQVGNTFNIREGIFHLQSERMKTWEFRTEYLYCHTGFRTGQHGIDAMRNGLPDFHIDAGEDFKAVTNVRHEFFLAAV